MGYSTPSSSPSSFPVSCLRTDELPPMPDTSLHFRKVPFFHSSFSHFPLATDLAKLSCHSQVQTCSAHVSDLPVFQSPHDLFPIFAASRYEAWLEETALNFLTPCLSRTDWFDTYSMITHSDPRHTPDTQRLPSMARRVIDIARAHIVHGGEELLLAWSSAFQWLIKRNMLLKHEWEENGGDGERNIRLLLGFPRENTYDSPQSLGSKGQEMKANTEKWIVLKQVSVRNSKVSWGCGGA